MRRLPSRQAIFGGVVEGVTLTVGEKSFSMAFHGFSKFQPNEVGSSR
jgi:hypothetical protein